MNEVLKRYEVAWINAKTSHDAMVKDAAATKSNLPDNYWHREHEARRKLQIARGFVEACKDE